MHREATDRNITPTTKQQLDAGSGTLPSEVETAELDRGIEVAPVRTEGTMEITASGPSLRWSAFEESLRQRREEVLQSSIENVKMDDARKASAESLSEQERIERRKAS